MKELTEKRVWLAIVVMALGMLMLALIYIAHQDVGKARNEVGEVKKQVKELGEKLDSQPKSLIFQTDDGDRFEMAISGNRTRLGADYTGNSSVDAAKFGEDALRGWTKAQEVKVQSQSVSTDPSISPTASAPAKPKLSAPIVDVDNRVRRQKQAVLPAKPAKPNLPEVKQYDIPAAKLVSAGPYYREATNLRHDGQVSGDLSGLRLHPKPLYIIYTTDGPVIYPPAPYNRPGLPYYKPADF